MADTLTRPTDEPLIDLDGRPARQWRNGKHGPQAQCSWCGSFYAAGPDCPVYLYAEAGDEVFAPDEPREWRCADCWDEVF